MKGKIKRLLACVLSVLTLGCYFSACKKDDKVSSPSIQTESSSQLETVKNAYIVEKGVSDYKIVVSEDAATNVKFAVSEFNTFFKKATSLELEVVTDKDKTFSDGAKYISIGENELQKQLKEEIENERAEY